MGIILESHVRKRKTVRRKGKAWGLFGKFFYSIKVTTKTLYSTYIHSNKHVKLYMRSIQISQRQTTTLININHSHMNHSSFFLDVPSFSICWDRVNLWFGWGCMWWILKPFILTQIFTKKTHTANWSHGSKHSEETENWKRWWQRVISSLLDCLLTSILSYLPIRDSVAYIFTI